jgi:hypothetical protein
VSRKVPADDGGRKQASGGRAGHAPKGPAGKNSGEKLNERPGKGYGGQEGGNAGKGPRNKKPWEKP